MFGWDVTSRVDLLLLAMFLFYTCPARWGHHSDVMCELRCGSSDTQGGPAWNGTGETKRSYSEYYFLAF